MGRQNQRDWVSPSRRRLPRNAVCAALFCFGFVWGVGCSGTADTGESAKQETSTDEDATGADASASEDTPSEQDVCKPEAEECNGQDDDCDGQTDEDLNCPVEGDTRPCYSGALDTKGKGTCAEGTQTYSAGKWGACGGEVGPVKEQCNGKDDDCDGQTDEALIRACKSDCGDGEESCQTGEWGGCDAPAPATETCNGQDDDCDGQVDEGCACKTGDTQACGSDEGSCSKGQQTCSAAGKWGACEGKTTATTEVCNAKDDDCDGQTDEALTKACYTGPSDTAGKGVCAEGKQVCAVGKWGECEGEIVPGQETCTGKDDDCNGKVDDLPELQCGEGPCVAKAPACDKGKPNVCKPNPGKEEACNGVDDDCDGTTDDDAPCPADHACTKGVCKSTAPTPHRTGDFQANGSYTVVGKVSVFKVSNGERFDFSSDFSTSNGPDLFVYLVKASNGAVSGNNFVSLGKLKKTTGTQSYSLSQSSAGYKSVVVWCKKFGVNFGYANLTP